MIESRRGGTWFLTPFTRVGPSAAWSKGMRMDEIVTVVIPVAGAHTRLVQGAVDSVRQQTLSRAATVLVVNDAGMPLNVRGAKLIETAGRTGAAHARNLALETVTTPFVLFLDADDLLVQVALEVLVRAYAKMDANYLYGDAYLTYGDGRSGYYTAPTYDRRLLLTYNIHNVTALLPTESVRAVGGFDEEIAGWEDWEFFARLAVNGYCGHKLPVPLIEYRQETGISREAHRQKQEVILADMRARYADFIKGERELMACCGSNQHAAAAAATLAQMSPELQGKTVLLEYIGDNLGTLSFRVNGQTYRGAATQENRFVPARASDVQALTDLGVWRALPAAVLMARRPDASAEATVSVSLPDDVRAVSVPDTQAMPEATAKPRARRNATK